MKKSLITILVLTMLLFTSQAFGANASTTATDSPKSDGSTVVTITALGDDSSGAFTPILFDNSTNRGIFRRMVGKWLTFARTTIGTTSPTASYDIYILDTATSTSEHVLTTATLAIGSNTDDVSTVAFSYVANGVAYSKAAVTTGTGPGNDVVPEDKYGAVAFDIGGHDGTPDPIEAAVNATGYDTAVLALAGIPAADSAHVRIGYITVMDSESTFTFGTDALNGSDVTTVYYSTIPAFDIMGGRLVDRSATVAEEVYPANTAGDNSYKYITSGLLVCIVNNSVAAATIEIELIFN